MIVFFSIVMVIVILVLIILLSSIQIELKDFTIDDLDKVEQAIIILIGEKNKEKKINILNKFFFNVNIKFLLLRKLPIINISLSNIKIKDILIKQNKKSSQKSTKRRKPKIQKLLKEVVPKIQLKQANFSLELGMENASSTAYITAIFSIVLSIFFLNIITEKNAENLEYTIKPVYLKKNVFFLQFSCIIKMNIVHIIEIICKKEEFYE